MISRGQLNTIVVGCTQFYFSYVVIYGQCVPYMVSTGHIRSLNCICNAFC